MEAGDRSEEATAAVTDTTTLAGVEERAVDGGIDTERRVEDILEDMIGIMKMVRSIL